MSVDEKQVTVAETLTECPICYELHNDQVRRLSCGHVFCHDCLVRTVVSATGDAAVIHEKIVCPMCRHLTYIKKQSAQLVDHGKGAYNGQILEIPFSSSLSRPVQNQAADESGVSSQASSPSALSRLVRFARLLQLRTQSRRAVASNTPRIFIISSQGRPMTDEDDISVVTTVSELDTRQGQERSCAHLRSAILFLVVLASCVAAATFLPWVLLD